MPLWNASRAADDQWLTTGEAARQIGVDPSTINRYVRAGELEPTSSTPGGHHRWKLEDLKSQLRQLREQTQSDRHRQARERDEQLRQESQTTDRSDPGR